MQKYRNHGLAFEYPEDWDLAEEGDEDCTTITVAEAEGPTFWSLHLMWRRPPVEEVLEMVEATFQEEYDDVDIEATTLTVARREAAARQLDFVCLELVNTAFVRAFRTGRFTAMILCQATDQELATAQQVFREITDSLDVDLDGEILIS
ncbi:MAG: hypothetical protein KDA58_05470 [Planctomycetaceae bacterium]|nr:hypothetical protein [Planctomycetaceae bacterium]